MQKQNFEPIDETLLETLASHFPTADMALAEIAAIRAQLALPKPVTHVLSDIHGEFGKLRHIINNASGTLRPLVERLFAGRMLEDEMHRFLAVLYYPHELHHCLRGELSDPQWRLQWVKRTLRCQAEMIRELGRGATTPKITALLPPQFQRLFSALIKEPYSGRGTEYTDAMIEAFIEGERDLDAVRAASRLVRNLAVAEILVAGDMGDRGPRIDRVIGYLMQQPSVSITWGNHDAGWMGACLGSEVLIASVLRISLRYRRLFQMEEGYGILLLPLEQLAQSVYGDDSAELFMPKNPGVRDTALVARMQKAIAVIQFKLEGQLIHRHPEWQLEHRNLLHKLSEGNRRVEIEGKTYDMLDTNFPTIDPANPYCLSVEEQDCMRRLRESFINSERLWQHMKFLARRGGMSLVRDDVVIFHGCVPVDEKGNWQALRIDGREVEGREMFTALDTLVRRAFRRGSVEVGGDLDWFWYLWCGPKSPLFGKDKITTFENYFVSDGAARHETKNRYFDLLHDKDFARRVAEEIGGNSELLVVNGHVPVKIGKGENPLKRGGNAVTIDGAFSEAYGDRGYTLLLTPDTIDLAEHHHFEGVGDAVLRGADIVPDLQTLRRYDKKRMVADTEEGRYLEARIGALRALISAYEEGRLLEHDGANRR